MSKDEERLDEASIDFGVPAPAFGRPTIYKAEMCQEVIDLMAEGKSKTYVAAKLGIAKQTLYNWIEAHSDFMDAIKLGDTLSQAYWEDIGQNAVMGKIEGFSGSAYIFNMKNRHGWRDQPEPKESAPQTVNITIQREKDE